MFFLKHHTKVYIEMVSVLFCVPETSYRKDYMYKLEELLASINT
jgi:hypothetical protein